MNEVQFYAPDGSRSSDLYLSTTSRSRFFRGLLPSGSVDAEVSIQGEPYTANPAWVAVTGTEFVFPNPAAYPDGWPLVSGENHIRVRAVGLAGERTGGAQTRVTLSSLPSWDLYAAPSPVTREQTPSTVRVTVEAIRDRSDVVGYNFWASTQPGGGAEGYSRISLSPVSTYTDKQRTTPLFVLTGQSVLTGTSPRYLRAQLSQQNEYSQEISRDIDDKVLVPDSVSSLETTVNVSQLETVRYCTFEHSRAGTPASVPPTVYVGKFASLPASSPLYYVVTAVYYDADTNTEIESPYSPEVQGSPVGVREVVRGLPPVSRNQILEDAIFVLHRADPNLAVQPGSLVRDTLLDPLSTEAERLRFLLDFVYRASSFDLLLAIDDPNNSGESVPPESSAYKTALARALFLANVADVQAVIDGAFDKLASQMGCPRLPGKRARSEVRFYTTATPARTLSLNLGTLCEGGGWQFRTLRTVELPLDQLASYYNPITRQYSLTVPVEAVEVGEGGNLGPRQINSASVFGFSVVNEAEAYGGLDAESNSELAARARGRLSSVDTGTQRGLSEVAARTAGVATSKVARAGSPLVVRDWDPTAGRSRGGAVDVWFRGRRTATFQDTFHFSYQRHYGVQFVPAGNPLNGVFRALGSGLTPSNPLVSMLDYESRGLGLRNISSGLFYDLTGATYPSYDTVALDMTRTQPATTLTDVVLGDYRQRSGDRYTFSRQPVLAVFGMVGEQTGTVDGSCYSLQHPQAALSEGRSVRAGDYLQLTGSADPTVSVPSGRDLQVTGELHVFNGFYPESVDRLGADSLTVTVTSTDSVTTYRGPAHPSGLPDYTVQEGSASTPLTLKRTEGSAIPDGGAVLVNYFHAENFTLTYQTNLVVGALQQNLDEAAHQGANVLAKEMIEVPLDFEAVVGLRKNSSRSTVDRALRNRLTNLVAQTAPGQTLRVSEVIATMSRTPGVAHVGVPLQKMARRAGSLVPYDLLPVNSPEDVFLVREWSTARVGVWLLIPELRAPTLNGGGRALNASEFRGVYLDSQPLDLVESDPSSLGQEPGRAFLVGNEGVAVPSWGTGVAYNRVMVSLPWGQTPVGGRYWASYVAAQSVGSRDLTLTELEYPVVGSLNCTYEEDPT